MLALGVAALACLMGLTDALQPTQHHFYKHDKSSGGNGYQLYDSYHKKDGDSYELEKQSVFGDGDGGKDGGSYHRTSSYNSGNHKPKIVSYHYETKHGTPRDHSKYNPETYEGVYSQFTPPTLKQRQPSTKPFSTPLRGESHKYLGKKVKETTAEGGRTHGISDSQSAEVEDAGFDFYDDGDSEGSFEGEFFSGEAENSFETDNSGEDEASVY